MSNLPTRAAVVWPDRNPDKNTQAARILVDYCDRAQLDIAAFAALPEALAMLTDGLVDAVVVATGRDLMASGIHVASAMAGRPVPVRRAETVTALAQRRPRVLPRGGAR